MWFLGLVVPTIDLGDPAVRASAVGALLAMGLTSKVAQSPLRRERRQWTKPANMTREAWRREDVAKWEHAGDAKVVAVFLQEWAKRQDLKATIVALDAGVRIKWSSRKKYLSASEERRLEKAFLGDPVELADSIYTYPKRQAATAAGGVDILVQRDVVTMARCAYGVKEPVKEASERKLVTMLTRDLGLAYGALPLVCARLPDGADELAERREDLVPVDCGTYDD